MTTHTRPSDRTRFARSAREAFGSDLPRSERPPHAGDHFVLIICAAGAVVLLILGVLP